MNNVEDILDDFVLEFKQRLIEQCSNSVTVMFTDYAWQWFYASKISKEKNTQHMYSNIIRVHLSFLSDVPISDIRQRHFQEAINRQLHHPRTCELIYLTFRQIIKSAARDRLISRSIVEDILFDVSLPKKITRSKRPLTPIEREAVKNVSLPPMKSCFIYLLYYTGMRKGEALALSPSDFDFDKKFVIINKTLIFTGYSSSEIKYSPKTSNGFRKIPLTSECVEKIYPYISSCGGYLFHGAGQGVVLANRNFYRRFWESIVLQLNIAVGYNPNAKKNKIEKPIKDLTAHIFRHDYCTQLCYQIPNITTKMIARLLGDSEKMVLEVYSHIIMEQEDVLPSLEKARTL